MIAKLGSPERSHGIGLIAKLRSPKGFSRVIFFLIETTVQIFRVFYLSNHATLPKVN